LLVEVIVAGVELVEAVFVEEDVDQLVVVFPEGVVVLDVVPLVVFPPDVVVLLVPDVVLQDGAVVFRSSCRT
jgi:hypothetical protein